MAIEKLFEIDLLLKDLKSLKDLEKKMKLKYK